MTANQISYLQAEENARANRARELLSERQVAVSEAQLGGQLSKLAAEYEKLMAEANATNLRAESEAALSDARAEAQQLQNWLFRIQQFADGHAAVGYANAYGLDPVADGFKAGTVAGLRGLVSPMTDILRSVK